MLYNLQGQRSQGKSEEQLKETKEAHVTTEGNVRFWPGSFCYKGHFQDYLWNLHGIWGQDDSQISVLIS